MSVTAGHPCDRGVVAAAPESTGCAQAARPWILVATILASSMAFIDGTVVNLALPALQQELGATVTDVQWVVEAYALFLAALMLLGGALGDRYGRRLVFGCGVAMFAAASAVCGLAPNIAVLIAARAAQGIAAALLVPGSLAIISASFPVNERGRAIGTWSGFSAITAAIGPVVGGWLIQHLSWRWAFFLNVPLAAVVLVLLASWVPESHDPDARRLDAGGAMLVTLGFGGITYALIESSHWGWGHPAIVGTLVLGVVALLAFAIVEARSPAPMVPLGLFRSPTFAGANLLTLFLYGALGGVLFFLPLDLIQVQHYSPAAAGASFLPFILLMFVLSRWSGGLVERFGPRPPLIAGPAITAVGFALLARDLGGSYWVALFPAMLVIGFGMAVTVAPLTTTVMNAVDAHRAGVASGINNAVSRVAGLLAITVMSILVLHVFNRELDHRVAAARLRSEVVTALDAERLKLGAARAPTGALPAEREAVRIAVAGSFTAGFRAVAWAAAVLAFSSVAAASLMIRSTPRPDRISTRRRR